ncbi:hypothetical protein HG531_001869 [Fusarium graminearum]|nr:hypothetical protein HG531_001869 [Fusarium graminearum]
MLLDLLHANTLSLGLLAFLVPQGVDLVALGEPLDELGSELSGVGLLRMVLAGRSHASNRASLKTGGRGKESSAGSFLRGSSTLGVHHEPLVLFFSVVFLEVLGGLPVDVVLSDGSQVSAAISLNYHQITRLDSETSALLNVEHISSSTLEQNDVQELVVAGLCNAVDTAMRRRCTIAIRVGQAVRRLVLVGIASLVRAPHVGAHAGSSAKVLAGYFMC